MFYDKKALAAGIKHEMEHTGDKALATKVAMDHLLEDPKYYDKLNKAGLEAEGALTPAEAGYVKECGCEGDCGCGSKASGDADVGIVAPVAPDVAVFKIDTPADIGIGLSDKGQAELSSSGLGSSGSPKPLKTDKLVAPAEKNQVGPNKVVVGNTPKLGGADALDHFGSQMLEKW